MKRQISNVAASVKQRLLNEAKKRGESFDYVASLYARERFLARLSISPHRDRLILKGATVLSLWLYMHRPTRDLDFLGSGSFDADHSAVVIRDIVGVATEDDGLVFDATSVTVEPMREPAEYRGVRVRSSPAVESRRCVSIRPKRSLPKSCRR